MSENKKLDYEDRKCAVCEKVHHGNIFLSTDNENSFALICLSCSIKITEYILMIQDKKNAR